MYGFLNSCGTVALFIYNLLHIEEQKEISNGRLLLWPKKQYSSKNNKFFYNEYLWLGLQIIIVSMFQYYLPVSCNRPFGNLVGTGANYYGLLFATPLSMYICCRILNIDIMKQMDLVTPAFPLALVFVKLACFAERCCRGIPWKYGVYNANRDITEFPAQLLESLMALILFVFFNKFRKKMKTGTVFPTYMIMYSAIRFFTEFSRVEPVVFLGLKRYQYVCLAGILVGIIEYWLGVKYSRKNYDENKLSAEN